MQERSAVRAAVVGAGLALLAGCSAGAAPQPAASPSSSAPAPAATATPTLVPPGQAGAANVLPVSVVGDSSPGVWLSVRDDGGLQGPLD